jgi:membrane-associated protein
MEVIKILLDFILHLDKHLGQIITDYQTWTYLILFIIIFVETGLIIMPFLPGDSLLFAAGMFAAQGSLNISYICGLLFVAAFLGDFVNYFIGKYFGKYVLTLKYKDKQIVKQAWIEQTEAFYQKHGSKAIIIARFVPIVRTVAPFVAGVGKMNYKTFVSFNIIGGAIWVFGLTLAGYFLGNIDIVKHNFEKVILGIIVLSVLPIIFQFFKKNKK